MVAKINDNAYKIDLPADEFGVSNSFNVADLTPYRDDLDASRSTPFQGGEDDEDIPSPLPSFPIDDVAAQDKPNEVRIGPMTRSRTKLLEQQVNSLLIEYDVCDYENFILPKSMHLCMIRVIDNTNTIGGEEQQRMEDMEDHMGNMKNNSLKSLREEREAGALEENESWSQPEYPVHS